MQFVKQELIDGITSKGSLYTAFLLLFSDFVVPITYARTKM